MGRIATGFGQVIMIPPEKHFGYDSTSRGSVCHPRFGSQEIVRGYDYSSTYHTLLSILARYHYVFVVR